MRRVIISASPLVPTTFASMSRGSQRLMVCQMGMCQVSPRESTRFSRIELGAFPFWVSSTVKDLTAGSGLAFEDRGEHELKGVPDRWHLYRVAS